jgi:AraC-like DNA-binding protein
MSADPVLMRDRPASPSTDPVSDMLSLLSTRSALSARLEAGGDWALDFAGYAGIKFVALLEGACWLSLAGNAPVQLAAGDCFLMTRGAPYRMGSGLAVTPRAASDVFARATDGIARVGQRVDAVAMGGRFDFDPSHASLLLDALPDIIHVDARSEAASVVRWVLARLANELAEPQPGAALMRDHLAHVLLLQMLRAHLATATRDTIGWLSALADPRIGRSLTRMHADPAARWTLESLARDAAMSRSAFALRFKSLVGSAPLDYLLRLRMLAAARLLRTRRTTIAAVAEELGYESDSAFGHAFKRVMGVSPGAYRTGG